jgi:hypothetical protein
MANLLTATAGVVTVDPYRSGGSATTLMGANNYKNAISTSDAGREFIVSITADADTLTDVKLNEAIAYLTSNNYTSSNTDGSTAATIAAIGTADGTAFDPAADTVVYVRLQTTDTFVITDFNAAQTNTTLAIVCEFKPAK